MTEELKADILEEVLAIGTGFGVFTGGMYLGFAHSMDLDVGSLETAALALGPSALNVITFTYLVQRRLSRILPSGLEENIKFEENIDSRRLVPRGAVSGIFSSLTLFGLSYGFGYLAGKMTEF